MDLNKTTTPLNSDEVRERYNKTIREVYKNQYEYERWFKTKALRGQYRMMRELIERILLSRSAGCCIEVGPGPGTWTKVLLEKHPNLECHLIDISSEMLDMARKNLAAYGTVRFLEADFSTYDPDEAYDLFFSSRAIEYVPDKERFIQNAYKALSPGGVGAIITKTPKHIRYALTGRPLSRFHSGQIGRRELSDLLENAGFTSVNLYPAIVIVPLFRSAFLNRVAWKIFSPFRLNWLSEFFSEAYCVTFEKPLRSL